MTAEAKFAPAAKKVGEDVAKTGAKAPYPFRTTWAIVLLAINFLVAAYYFHILE
ncbi:photosystem one PsaX [Nostocales cyanobacterium HT-58-2]|nr:photosystem one PsaX [Nostocales cyanobacterium HT-58-2]